MNLRGIVRIYAVGAVVLLAALLGATVAAVSTLERATSAEARRFHSLRLADELRQTSDDLTRMGRTYVVTGDRRYRDYFEEILAIRDGRAPRPEAYDRIYWDVVTSTGQRPRPFGPAVAYEVLAAEAGFTETELGLLADGRRRSDTLAVFEKDAFAAVVATARRYSQAAVAVGFMLLGAIVFMAVGVRRAVLRPIAALDAATKRIAAGDLNVAAPVDGVPEIGALAERFNGMTRSLRDEAAMTARRTAELGRSKDAAEEASRAKSTFLPP